MNSGGYDDMGPRIEIGPETNEPGFSPQGSPARPSARPIPVSPRRSGSSYVSWIGLLLALLALVVALWAGLSQPDPVPGPPPSPGVVPGGAAERVASLEKDVQDLILRVVTMEKEIQALGKKAGSVTKLTELSNRLAGLQDRLDSLTLDIKTNALARKSRSTSPPPAEPKAVPQAKPEIKKTSPPESEPQQAPKKAKKLTYKVRPGDSLFSIALRYKVTVKDLMKWNSMNKGDVLKANDELVIYK